MGTNVTDVSVEVIPVPEQDLDFEKSQVWCFQNRAALLKLLRHYADKLSDESHKGTLRKELVRSVASRRPGWCWESFEEHYKDTPGWAWAVTVLKRTALHPETQLDCMPWYAKRVLGIPSTFHWNKEGRFLLDVGQGGE